jgi:hypothetical protein
MHTMNRKPMIVRIRIGMKNRLSWLLKGLHAHLDGVTIYKWNRSRVRLVHVRLIVSYKKSYGYSVKLHGESVDSQEPLEVKYSTSS